METPLPEDADTTTSQGSAPNGPTEEERFNGHEAPQEAPANEMAPQRSPMDSLLDHEPIYLAVTMESPTGPLARIGLFPHSKTATKRLVHEILDTIDRQQRAGHCDMALVKPEVIDLTEDDNNEVPVPTTSGEQPPDETTHQPPSKRRRRHWRAWAFKDFVHAGFRRHLQYPPQLRYMMAGNGMGLEGYPFPRCSCSNHCSNHRPFRWNPHRSAEDRVPHAEQSPVQEPQVRTPTYFNHVPNELPLSQQFPYRVRYACQEAGCRSSLDQKNLMQHVDYHRRKMPHLSREELMKSCFPNVPFS